MSKKIFALAIGLLLVCGFMTTANAQTHMVFVENGSATW